jgi:hypothetical protein
MDMVFWGQYQLVGVAFFVEKMVLGIFVVNIGLRV